jgi:serine/threonine protein kinase
LGILTYELLFGKSPFESEIIKISRNKEQKAELTGLVFPASTPVSADTRSFIENLLSEDPEQRMEMDEVLQHPFLREEMSRKPLTQEGL